MMRLVRYIVAFACGCNQVFGLTPTTSTATKYYDAMPDAPFECPAIGSGGPAFTGVVVQQLLQDCSQYSPSPGNGGRAVAGCRAPDGTTYICEGPIDLMLTYALPSPSGIAPTARLSVDANTIYAFGLMGGIGSIPIFAYARTGSTWTQTTPFGMVQDAFTMSNFMRGPTGDHVFFVRNSASGIELLDEWGNEGGTWHSTSTHSPSEMGVAFVQFIALTSDGLHALVFARTASSQMRTMYTARPSLDAAFGPAIPLTGLFGAAEDAALTDNCARVYFTGLASVFYVQQ
jgi:hypothetical protein